MINALEILKDLCRDFKGDNFEISDIEWKVQNQKKDSALFFKSSKSYEKYLDKTEGFKLVITDSMDIYNGLKENKILIDKENWLESQKRLLDEVYPLSLNHVTGITGTNGKTSTTHYLEELIFHEKKNVLRIGTLGVFYNKEKKMDFSLTTPSFIDLRKCLHEFKDADYVILEASSHALEQERFYNIPFNLAAWTNFSQDHLDYHKTMKEYFNSKLKILRHLDKKEILVPIEEEIEDSSFTTIPVEKLDFSKEEIENNPELGLLFNQKNISLAYALFKEIFNKDSNFKKINFSAPDGRFNFIKYKNSLIVIDFAHTPDALLKICESLKKSFSQKKLKVLFGCGGDRDPSKRPLMASAVEKYADSIILTSDNPRFEDPSKIIEDAFLGFKDQKKVLVEIDRVKALKIGMESLDSDVFLIAGKGHEPYLDIKGEKIPFNDKEEILKYIND